MNDEAARFPAPWVRAALDLAILGVLAERPTHGYALAQRLTELGLGRLRGGSLYPVLARLEEARLVTGGWVAADAGPGRKEYRLTDRGRAHLAQQLQQWEDLTAALTGQARRGKDLG